MKTPVDPETARCLKELRSIIKLVEDGRWVLRHFADALTEGDGLHREMLIRVTYTPPKV